MIGEVIEEQNEPRAWWLFWLLLALTLTATNFAVSGNNCLRLSAAPFALSVVCWLSRRRSFALRIDEDGLRVLRPLKQLIYYDQLEELSAHGELTDEGAFAFEVIHSRGVLAIPDRLNVFSRDLWNFLQDRLPPAVEVRLPSGLALFSARRPKFSGRTGSSPIALFRKRTIQGAGSGCILLPRL